MARSFIARAIAAGLVGSGYLASGCTSCFVGDTLVRTRHGRKRIAEVEVGDELWTWDHETSRLELKEVERVWSADSSTLLTVVSGDVAMRGVTATHPVFDAVRSIWRPAGQLAVGDAVLLWSEEQAPVSQPVTALRTISSEAKQPVFNLTIRGRPATFFADDHLVHNKTPPRPQPIDFAIYVDLATVTPDLRMAANPDLADAGVDPCLADASPVAPDAEPACRPDLRASADGSTNDGPRD